MSIPQAPDQDLHATMLVSGDTSQLFSFRKTREHRKQSDKHSTTRLEVRLKADPPRTNLKILQATQPPPRHLAPLLPRTKRAATPRHPPL